MINFFLLSSFVYAFFVPGLIVFSGTVFGIVLFLLLLVTASVFFYAIGRNSSVRTRSFEAGSFSQSYAKESVSLWWWVPVCFLLIALIRGSVNNTDKGLGTASQILLLQFLSYIVLCCLSVARFKSYSKILDRLFWALAILCATNLLLWLAGISSPAAALNPTTTNAASILGAIGLDVKRTLFPISNGTTDYGRICGLVICFGFYKVGQTKSVRKRFIAAMAYIAIPLVQLLLTDSRGAILYSLAASSLYLWSAKSLRIRVGFIVGFLLILPFVSAILSQSGAFAQDAFFTRGDSRTGIFTGREVIWLQAFSLLVQFNPIHLIGYGAYGQASSGLSALYDSEFIGFRDDSDLISLHNGLLQGMFDYGYVGIFFIAVVFVFSVNRYINRLRFSERDRSVKKANRLSRAPLVIFCYLIVSGATEAVPGPYSPECLFVLMVALGSMLIHPKNGFSQIFVRPEK